MFEEPVSRYRLDELDSDYPPPMNVTERPDDAPLAALQTVHKADETNDEAAAAVWVNIDKLKAWENNPRKNDHAVDRVAASIDAFGFGAPVLARKANNEVIAGHTRIKAALKLGMTRVPVRFLDLSARDAHVLAVADNKLSELADWDTPVLEAVLADLKAHDAELSLTGFDDAELAELLSSDAPGVDDVAPIDEADELRKKWHTERGQLWTIGPHRLLCGDCTIDADVARLMNGEKAVLMNTDPPYGVDYAVIKAGMPGFTACRTMGDIENDGLTDGAALQAFLESAIRAGIPHMTQTAAFYFWHPMLTQGSFFAAAAAADILIHRQIIWVKPGFVLTRSGMYHWKHELCFYGWVRGHQPPWYGDKSQTSVWEIGRDEDAGMHPTQKPIELFTRPMDNHAKKGEVVYEPFSGSGSQLVAAEHAGRRCYAMDIDARYVAVALERLANLGCTPKLAA